MATAIVMLLRGREVTEAQRGVTRVADGLREQSVTPEKLDHRRARRLLAELEQVANGFDTLSADELEAAARRAAAWAEAASTPSSELTAAVALRSAANDLRRHVLDGNEAHRASARRHLARARRALEGDTATTSMQGVKDRVENLQESQREQYQQLDEALQ